MILITGANGQLGTELRHLLDERNEEYVAVDVAEMDITNAEKVDEVFAEVKPVDSSQFPAKAKRPLNSTMSLAKAKATGFVIPSWKDALKEFYKQEVK